MRTSEVINVLDSELILIPNSKFVAPGTGYVAAPPPSASVKVYLWCINVLTAFTSQPVPELVVDGASVAVGQRSAGLGTGDGWVTLKTSDISPSFKSGHRYVMTIVPESGTPWYNVTVGPFGYDDGRMDAVTRFRSWAIPTGDTGEDNMATYYRMWSDNNKYLSREIVYNGTWAGPVRFCDVLGVPTDTINDITPLSADPSTIQFLKGTAAQDYWQILVWPGNDSASDTGAMLDDLCQPSSGVIVNGSLIGYKSGAVISYNKVSTVTERTFINTPLQPFHATIGGWCGLPINTSAAGDPAYNSLVDNVRFSASARAYYSSAYKPGVFDLDSMISSVGADRIMALCPYRVVTRSSVVQIEYYKFNCPKSVYDGTLGPDDAAVLANRIGYRVVKTPLDDANVTYEFNMFNPTNVCIHNFVPVIAG